MFNYEHLVAGISGGVFSTLVLHPLDLLKVRLAVNDGNSVRPKYNGLVDSISSIFRQEGVRGFYRGVAPNCVGAGASWGLYFLFYNTIKSRLARESHMSVLGPSQHIMAACEAGTATLVLTNPIWVVKTQLCLQYADNGPPSGPAKGGTGMWDALRKIYGTEGVRGLYRGFVPGLFGVSHGALQFMAYEELKHYFVEHNHLEPHEKLSTSAYLTCAASSKLFAVVSTYPYQVLRARLQDHHVKYSGVLDVINRTWAYEGVKGFYKGIVPNIIRVTPACCITFVVYENVSYFLLSLSPTSSSVL